MNRFVVRLGALGAAAVAALALLSVMAPAADAKVTWRGIAGVKLGMSERALQAKLGRPRSVAEDRAPGSKRYSYRRSKLLVAVHEGRVVAVHTKSRAQRTLGGVRVGVSERAMRRKVRGETCGTARRLRVCSVARGRTVLEFVCRRGRVVRIGLSRLG